MKLHSLFQSLQALTSGIRANIGQLERSKKNPTAQASRISLKESIGLLWIDLKLMLSIIVGMTLTMLLLVSSFLRIIYVLMAMLVTILRNIFSRNPRSTTLN